MESGYALICTFFYTVFIVNFGEDSPFYLQFKRGSPITNYDPAKTATRSKQPH